MLATTIIWSVIIIFCYMTLAFFIAEYKKDNSIADVAWGIGFVIIALFSLIKNNLYMPIHLLVTSLILIWGFRLSGQILLRNWDKKEDLRYLAWRKQWGTAATIRSFLQVFMLQGLILLIIAYPIMLINSSNTSSMHWLTVIGFFIWCIGFFFEAVGDWQLYHFLKKPANKGKIMMQGLWHYTRHPNYFGEIAMWWGIFLIALCVPWGITAIISPLLITYLLIFVSGIPLTERQFINNHKYQEYKKRTSKLIPWPPKKNSH